MKTYKTLFFSLLIIPLFASCSKPQDTQQKDINATMINIHGTSDKRLRLFFISTYRPMNISSGNLPPECLSSSTDYNTARKKVELKFEGVLIENQDEYNITIPVYNKDLRSKCTYKFAGINLRIMRMYDGERYATIPVLTDTPIATLVPLASGSMSSTGIYIKTKEYFRIPDGTKVSCFTEEYEKSNNTHFVCRPSQQEINSSVDFIKDMSIKLDIDVDDSLCRYLFKSKKLSIYSYKNGNLNKEEQELFLSKQGHFKEDIPLHIKIKKLITGE